MADAAKSSNVASDGGSDSGTNEESVDQDFDITADMMVHDMDDETTLEEEEKLDNKENFSEEIADLEKEGDMPLEDLLAMYGYHSDESETQAPDEPVTKTDVLPPLISARQAIHDPDLPNQSEKEDSIPLEDASPVPSPLMQEQSDYAPSPQSNNNQNNVFPENQRITRGLLAAYSYFNLGESSSSDDDDEYNPEEWKKEIHIGEEHQAVVPEGLNTEKEYTYDGVDKCLWNPSNINEQELQRYLNSVCKPPGADIQREVKRDDEQALYMLLQCSYDVSEAVRRQKSQTKPQAEMALWSEEECRDFESGLRIYGKDFLQIQQNKVTSRSVNEIVQFYYLWKKTERHDAYASQSRLAKKKYTFHPGITDYMDRFLDENESAASSRASSPHNFSARARLGNGLSVSHVSSTVQTTPSTPQTTSSFSVPSGSHHTTVTMMSGQSHLKRDHLGATPGAPSRPPQLQSCVPTSVIVSSPEKGDIAPKRPRLDSEGRMRLNTVSSKPPPLKPIASLAPTVSRPPPPKDSSYGMSTVVRPEVIREHSLTPKAPYQ